MGCVRTGFAGDGLCQERAVPETGYAGDGLCRGQAVPGTGCAGDGLGRGRTVPGTGCDGGGLCRGWAVPGTGSVRMDAGWNELSLSSLPQMKILYLWTRLLCLKRTCSLKLSKC